MKLENADFIEKVTNRLNLENVKLEEFYITSERNRYNVKLFLEYICPLISQQKKVEISSSCLLCSNKKISKSDKLVYVTENYIKDVYALYDRVINLAKFIYGIDPECKLYQFLKDEKLDILFKEKFEEIKNKLSFIHDLRVDSTHINSPLEDDRDIHDIKACEMLLQAKSIKPEIKEVLSKRKEYLYGAKIVKIEDFMNGLNEYNEKKINELLEILKIQYEENNDRLSDVEYSKKVKKRDFWQSDL